MHLPEPPRNLVVIEPGSGVQVIATIPEFFWELSLGIYLIVKGFKSSSPLLAMPDVSLVDDGSARRRGPSPSEAHGTSQIYSRCLPSLRPIEGSRPMKKPVALAILPLALMLGVGTAVAAVSWPSTATTWAGVNSHLNALHETDGLQFSRVRVVKDVAEASGGNAQHGSAHCPDGWTLTGGGYRNDDADWYSYSASPTFPMGPTEVTPNGYSADFSNPTFVDGDPFPIITVYAICVT